MNRRFLNNNFDDNRGRLVMRIVLFFVWLMIPFLLHGQEERRHIREGYKAYMEENYQDAEIGFRKAEEANRESYIARYNTSAALYQQQQLEESGERFAELMEETSDPAEQAKLLHNIGNVLTEGEQYKEAVAAYKQSLKLNPSDEDTRYNLAYALEKLREQEQQEQNQDQDQDQDQDQEQNQNQDNQDNRQQEQEQEQQDEQQNQQEQEQQQQQQEEQEQDQQEQQPQQQQELSKEEAERLLNAILQKEKDIKEEVDKKRAQQAKIKTDKDW
jgi:Ca-activated chloride channel homolog